MTLMLMQSFSDKMENVFSRDNLDSVQEKPGCYIWFLNVARIREKDFEEEQSRKNLLEALFSIHQPNSMHVNISRLHKDKMQQFGENYSGPVHIADSLILQNSEIVTNKDSFLSFLQITGSLPIPLYIGKSENLYRRIRQHNLFLKGMASPTNPLINQQEYDSLRNFSERFNNIIEKHRSSGISLNMLHVKVIYLPLNAIADFETNLNRLYKPILGIK
jgi:hypothetical protein